MKPPSNSTFENSYDFMQGSVKTYTKAVRILSETWESVLGEELTLRMNKPKSRFEEAVGHFSAKLRAHRAPELLDTLRKNEKTTPEISGLSSDIEEILEVDPNTPVHRDIDDAPPNLCKQMIRDAIQDLANQEDDDIVDLSLREVLREAMRRLAPNMDWPSPARVGANSNFDRLWQYVYEACEESSWHGGQGSRIINTRGPIPHYPIGPGNLRIRANKAFL